MVKERTNVGRTNRRSLARSLGRSGGRGDRLRSLPLPEERRRIHPIVPFHREFFRHSPPVPDVTRTFFATPSERPRDQLHYLFFFSPLGLSFLVTCSPSARSDGRTDGRTDGRLRSAFGFFFLLTRSISRFPTFGGGGACNGGVSLFRSSNRRGGAVEWDAVGAGPWEHFYSIHSRSLSSPVAVRAHWDFGPPHTFPPAPFLSGRWSEGPSLRPSVKVASFSHLLAPSRSLPPPLWASVWLSPTAEVERRARKNWTNRDSLRRFLVRCDSHIS